MINHVTKATGFSESKAIANQAWTRPFGFQEVEVSGISRQSTHEVGMVVSPTHWPPLSTSRYS